jgi:hypothetical protein
VPVGVVLLLLQPLRDSAPVEVALPLPDALPQRVGEGEAQPEGVGLPEGCLEGE